MSHTNALVWTLKLVRPGQPDQTVAHIPDPFGKQQTLTKQIDDLTISLELNPEREFTSFKAEVNSNGTAEHCYLRLLGESESAEIHTFNGRATAPEIYRQSPHDPADHVVDIAKQAVPMIAFKIGSNFTIAVNDAPAFCENHTTQSVNPAGGRGIDCFRG